MGSIAFQDSEHSSRYLQNIFVLTDGMQTMVFNLLFIIAFNSKYEFVHH